MFICTPSRITPDTVGVTSGEEDPTYFIDDTLGTVPAVPVGNCLEDVPIRCTLVSKMACLFRRGSVLVDHHREAAVAGHMSDGGITVMPEKKCYFHFTYLSGLYALLGSPH
jgi:hypothetical protein